MMFSFPWYYYIAIGVFLGLFMGNLKFRKECEAILAKLMGSKKKKTALPDKGSIRGDENGNKRCVVCGNSGIMALVFDNDRWICRQCLMEIEGSRNNQGNQSKTQRRGTHIRDIYLDND